MLTFTGLLNLVSTSHLIVITKREQVALIHGRVIFAVRDVLLVPLTSQSEAEKAVAGVQKTLKQDKNSTAGEETDETDIEDDADTSAFENPEPSNETEVEASEPPKGPVEKRLG